VLLPGLPTEARPTRGEFEKIICLAIDVTIASRCRALQLSPAAGYDAAAEAPPPRAADMTREGREMNEIPCVISYNAVHLGLRELSVQPHLLTHDVLLSLLRRLRQFAGDKNPVALEPGHAWPRPAPLPGTCPRRP